MADLPAQVLAAMWGVKQHTADGLTNTLAPLILDFKWKKKGSHGKIGMDSKFYFTDVVLSFNSIFFFHKLSELVLTHCGANGHHSDL